MSATDAKIDTKPEATATEEKKPEVAEETKVEETKTETNPVVAVS